jgi:hypothetical protein
MPIISVRKRSVLIRAYEAQIFTSDKHLKEFKETQFIENPTNKS